jgi:muramidase (phage lysozyme)
MNIPGLFEPTAAEAACQDYTAFPAWKGFRGSHAAGAYQFQPATWAWVASITGVPDFSPIAQDINALWLLRQVGPNSTASWAASGPYPNPYAEETKNA